MSKFMTLTDHVYEYIANEILQGNISPGEKVSENTICEVLSVSRTPVREALIELACDKILENVPRKGFIVRTLTLKNLTEIYSVIGILEGEAAALACDNLSKQNLDDMKFYIDSMGLAIDQSNYSMYHKHQDAFHSIFVEKCNNETLISSILHLKNQLLRKTYDKTTFPNINEVLKQTNEEHKIIYDLFNAGESEKVAQYIKNVHWKPQNCEFEII